MKGLPCAEMEHPRPASFATDLSLVCGRLSLVLLGRDENRPGFHCFFDHPQGTADAKVDGSIVRIGLRPDAGTQGERVRVR
jgi:hypothetical protein